MLFDNKHERLLTGRNQFLTEGGKRKGRDRQTARQTEDGRMDAPTEREREKQTDIETHKERLSTTDTETHKERSSTEHAA